MNDLIRSPKLRLQAALFDIIEYCGIEDWFGIKEIWIDLNQQEQEQVWSFLSSNQKSVVRQALAHDFGEAPF
jgi:hypothetical protein